MSGSITRTRETFDSGEDVDDARLADVGSPNERNLGEIVGQHTLVIDDGADKYGVVDTHSAEHSRRESTWRVCYDRVSCIHSMKY